MEGYLFFSFYIAYQKKISYTTLHFFFFFFKTEFNQKNGKINQLVEHLKETFKGIFGEVLMNKFHLLIDTW